MKDWRAGWGAIGKGALFLVIQAALVAGYLAVEAWRQPAAPFLSEVLDEPAPSLGFERRSRPVEPSTPGDRALLVHFWATWCAPCRKELPGLLAATRAEGVPLLAATDEEWATVEAFFEGPAPDEVVRDPQGKVAKAFRVSAYPDTFVVQRGRVTRRAGGARDWEGEEGRRFLRSLK